ncbi:hypothetical protein [Dictyobacter kobayashii]|nr:hypothetical protein [Dictyobacter kobayashii]
MITCWQIGSFVPARKAQIAWWIASLPGAEDTPEYIVYAMMNP